MLSFLVGGMGTACAIAGPQARQAQVHEPVNGSIVIEAESVRPTGDWSRHSFVEETPAQKTKRIAMLFDPASSELDGVKEEQTLVYHFKTAEEATYRIAMLMGRDPSKFQTPDPDGDKSWGDVRNNDVYLAIYEADTNEPVQEPVRLFVGIRRDLNDRMVWGNHLDFKMGEHRSWRNSRRSEFPLKADTVYRLEVSGRGDGVIIDRIAIRSDAHLRNTAAHRAPVGQAVPELPTPSISEVDMTQHRGMKRWSEVGVRGGIPTDLPVAMTIGPEQDLQEAIDRVHQKGGGVLLLKKGEYFVRDDSIQMKSRVVVRGEDRDGVRIESRLTSDQRTFTFKFEKGTRFAGLENLTINYVPPAGGLPDHTTYKNLEDSRTLVGGVRTFEGASDNWVMGCTILNSGTDPIFVSGHHNTMTRNYVDGSYSKAGGKGYYRVAFGHDNLIKGETVKNLRHFGILTRRAAYNVVVECFFATDINLHTGDVGHNLFEGNSVHLPEHHGWGVTSTGLPRFSHMPPGDGNLLVNNLTRHERYDHSVISQKDVVYTFEGYGDPVMTNIPVPEGGRFYVPAWPAVRGQE